MISARQSEPGSASQGAPASQDRSDQAELTRQRFRARVSEKGDLPIVRNNGAKILKASENSDSGAGDVARLILQDPGFAAKVLKVANSAYYNRTDDRIGTISRAVVILGMDMVRQVSLGLGFVEMFEKDHPGVDMRRLVANSFSAAVIGQELAQAVGHDRPEEIFVAALLNNLGAISLAYYMPEAHLELRQQLADDPEACAQEAERQLLGVDCRRLGADLAQEWKLPPSVAEGIESGAEAVSGRASNPSEKMKAAVFLANRITENLFGPQARAKDLDLWLGRMETSLALSDEKSLKLVEQSCTRVRRMARSFEMEPSLFRPAGADDSQGESKLRRRLVARLDRAIALEEARQEGKSPGAVKLDASQSQDGSDSSCVPDGTSSGKDPAAKQAALQLRYLRDITLHLMDRDGDLNQLFRIILEGMLMGIGFDRVILALVNPERTRFKGRFALGHDAESLASRFDLPNDAKDNLFAKAYQERKPRLVESVDRLGLRHLVPRFLKTEGRVRSLVLTPIHADDRVIGFFYADKAVSGRPISESDYQAFLHFALQANMGLERLNPPRG